MPRFPPARRHGRHVVPAIGGTLARAVAGGVLSFASAFVRSAIGLHASRDTDVAVVRRHPQPAQPHGSSKFTQRAKPANLWQVIKTAVADWLEDRAPRLGAALAYYTLFSIAPLLLVVIAIAGLIFGADAVRGQLDHELQGFIGRESADVVQDMVARARKPGASTVASVVGVVVLLIGASGVFGQLKDALNTIWEAEPLPGRGLLGTIQDRFLSFAMVLGVGFLLLVSLVLHAILAAAGDWIANYIPGPAGLLEAANSVVTFIVVTLLFALIFKYLPDVQIAWKDVWLGAVVTAGLFTVGMYLFGLYLAHGAIGSTYGAAGSVVVILLWAYYSSQILLLGAEFTQAYSRAYGSRFSS